MTRHTRSSSRAPALVALLLVSTPSVVQAATVVVDASGGGDYLLVQPAVTYSSSGDTIEIRAGTYAETVAINGKSLTLQGAGSGSVTIQADGSDAALSIDGSTTVELSGLTLTNGGRGLTVRVGEVAASDLIIESNSSSGNGGGVGVYEGAELTLEDCTIRDNEALTVYNGGAIHVDASTLIMDGCTVSGNEAEQGGAIYAEAATLELNDTSFDSNTARSHGGAIRLRDGSSLTASSVTLDSNTASGRGGGVSAEDSDSSWASSVMSSNTAATGGGAMHLSGQASTGSTVDASIQDNTSSGAGGGIWAWDHDLRLSGELLDNISPDSENGGGVYVSSLDLDLVDITISGHLASSGGGVYASTGSTVTLDNAVISENEAVEDGGGIYSAGYLSSTASYLQDNLAGGQGGGAYVTDAGFAYSGGNMQRNSAGAGGGGALVRGGTVSVTSAGIRDNSSAQGGGLCCLGASVFGVMVNINHAAVTGNTATSSGGGLYVDSTHTVDFAQTEFSGNSSGAWGGGLYLLDIGTVELESLDVSDNEALLGGGLYAASVSGEAWDLDVAGNSVTGEGGGLVLSAPDGAFELRNSRIVENEAFLGGGLYLSADSDGLLTVTNVDVVANSGGGVWLASAPASSLINAIVVGNDGVGVGADDADQIGTLGYDLVWGNDTDWGGELADSTGSGGNLSADPLYASWADDGDPATELLLLKGLSPARDAGDPSLSDLDGSRSDMGSFGGPGAEDGDYDGDGWSRSDGDCDDSAASAYPGATEVIYDGVDNDCDASTPDDDLDGDGYGHEQDCNEDDPDIHPGADDPYGDGVDQDCDGADGENPDTGPDDTGPDDTGDEPENPDDRDGDGYSPPEDCNDLEDLAHPGMYEICDDGFDNDCDGYVDASDGDCPADELSCYGCASPGRARLALTLPWVLGILVTLRRRRTQADVPTAR